MNIRSKLSLSFLATVVTLSVALSAIIARDTVSLAKESIAYDAALQAKMIDRVFETFIDKVKADVEYLAKNYRYQQIPVELSKYRDSTPRLADSQAVGGFEAELERNIVTSIWSVTGPLALVFIVLGVYLAGRITRPIDHVSDSLRHMVEGDVDFDNALDVTSNDEIGKLAMRFNAFLRSAKKKQSALVHSQKLESIGRLAAGMAQEIDRPAQSIGDNTRFLEKAFRNLNSLITRLGELAANAKDSDLLESIREAMREADVEKLHVEIPRAIERSLQGVRQVSEIVGAMGEFSQPSQEMTQMDLNSAIRNTIMVGRQRMEKCSHRDHGPGPGFAAVDMPARSNQRGDTEHYR